MTAANITHDQVAVGPDIPSAFGIALRQALTGGYCAAFVRELEAIIGRPVAGIALYGSLVRDASLSQLEYSDIDMLVLTDTPISGGIFGVSDGLQIDLHLQHKETTITDPETNWLYAGSRVIFDRDEPAMSLWLKSLHEWLESHSEPWSAADLLRGRMWAERLVSKIIRLNKSDPAVSFLHEARLLAAIPQLQAQSRRKRTTSIGNWWQTLQVEDSELYEAFTRYTLQRTNCFDGTALRSLIAQIYSEEQKAFMVAVDSSE